MFRTYSATAPPRSRPTRRRRADGRPRVGVSRRVAARSSSHRCGRPRRMRPPDPPPAGRGRAFAEHDAAGARGPRASGRTRPRGRRRGGRSRAARPIRCRGRTDRSRARWPAQASRAAPRVRTPWPARASRASWPAAGPSPGAAPSPWPASACRAGAVRSGCGDGTRPSRGAGRDGSVARRCRRPGARGSSGTAGRRPGCAGRSARRLRTGRDRSDGAAARVGSVGRGRWAPPSCRRPGRAWRTCPRGPLGRPRAPRSRLRPARRRRSPRSRWTWDWRRSGWWSLPSPSAFPVEAPRR